MGKSTAVLRNARWHGYGWCVACGRRTVFICADPTTARGNLYCVWCRSFSRKRHLISLFLEEMQARSLRELAAKGLERPVYSTTSGSRRDVMWRYLAEDPFYETSELVDGIPVGSALPSGGTCQNLECLTFSDESFDVILNEDVMEHVRAPDRAWAEIARVLRPGGIHLFTVPFLFDRSTVERVEPSADGRDKLLMEPEWHCADGTPILAYRTYGIDLFQRLEGFGFRTTLHIATMPDRRRGIVDSYVFRSELAI